MKFFDQIRARWHAFVERLRFKYMPRIAHWVVHLSTHQARSRLSKSGPIAVLVDNTVLSHGVTHETGWVSTGMQKWGPHDVPTGYAARIPVHDPDDDSRGYQDVQ